MEVSLISPGAAIENWDYYEPPLALVMESQRVGGKPKYTTTWMKALVRSGKIKVFETYEKGTRVGYAFGQVDDGPGRRTWFVWMAYLEDASPLRSTEFWEETVRWASRFRCDTVECVCAIPKLYDVILSVPGFKEVYRGFAAEVKQDG